MQYRLAATLVFATLGLSANADETKRLSTDSLDAVTAGALGGLCSSPLACAGLGGLGGGAFIGVPIFSIGCAFGGDDCSAAESSASAQDGDLGQIPNIPSLSLPATPDFPPPTSPVN